MARGDSLLIFEDIWVFICNIETEFVHLCNQRCYLKPLIKFSSRTRAQSEASLLKLQFKDEMPVRLFRFCVNMECLLNLVDI